MDTNDRQAIEALFDKLATVERQSPPRDGESEAFIRDKRIDYGHFVETKSPARCGA
jgi:hypothetical protein